jgi:heme exporter protein A
MPDPLLTVHDLACARGERLLFKEMNFSLNAGELLLVQGGNGQGKTSLLRLLTGLARPEAGEVRWRGESIRRVNEVYHAEMCYLGHANGVRTISIQWKTCVLPMACKAAHSISRAPLPRWNGWV